LLINQGIGKSTDSCCFVCNMSEEPLYLVLLVAELHTSEGDWECPVTDFRDEEHAQNVRDRTSQGPLNSGQYRVVADFGSLINRVLRDKGLPELNQKQSRTHDLYGLSIHAICIYSAKKMPVGASRHFKLLKDNGYLLKPSSLDTETLSSRKQRRRVTQWLEDHL
jgi:hypothetical protein